MKKTEEVEVKAMKKQQKKMKEPSYLEDEYYNSLKNEKRKEEKSPESPLVEKLS